MYVFFHVFLSCPGAKSDLFTLSTSFLKLNTIQLGLSQLASQLAARATFAKQAVPHYYLSVDLDLTNLLSTRTMLNAKGGVTLSVQVRQPRLSTTSIHHIHPLSEVCPIFSFYKCYSASTTYIIYHISYIISALSNGDITYEYSHLLTFLPLSPPLLPLRTSWSRQRLWRWSQCPT
jgi:hypothetical protein